MSLIPCIITTTCPDGPVLAVELPSIVTAINAALGKAQVFRVRTEKPRGQFVAALRTAVTVTWTYDTESMFPVGHEKDAMVHFERAADPLSSENGLSELVQVSTGGGVKE